MSLLRLAKQRSGIFLAAGLCLAAFARADDTKLVTGNTAPSLEAKLTFAAPGLVTDVLVNKGDHVKVGQVLAKQDDREDQAELQRITMEAKSMAKIENYQADQAVKQVQLDRKEKLLKIQQSGADANLIALSEVEEARLDLKLAKTQVDMTQLEHDQKGLDALKQQIKVDLEQLKSPIDGYVEKRNINPGEMAAADPQNHDGAIVVVQNDPLWVELRTLPASEAQMLKRGQILQVQYPGEAEWQSAKVIYIAPEADAGSDTQAVTLELPNPSGRDSGLQIQVKLPDNVAAVAADAGNP